MKSIFEVVRTGQLRLHQRAADTSRDDRRARHACLPVALERLGPNVWLRTPSRAQFDTQGSLLGAT